MTLTVLNVAYSMQPVCPASVGGSEQIIAQLDAGLTGAGHHSIVIACAGSSVKGTLLPTPEVTAPFDEIAVQCAHERQRLVIEEALSRWPVDVVHLHGLHFYRYLPPPGVPVLITLHMMPNWYPQQIFWPFRTMTFLHCVSAAQQHAGPGGASLLPVIENGVDVAKFAVRVSRRDFVLSLGRICHEKGFHLALDAARRAGMPMLLAGQVSGYESDGRYFQNEIVPRLDRSHRFIGAVGFERKRRLLSAARALLVPSLIAETSSLVAMEAFACGTPVIAFKAGALTDIVEHGKTGFLVEDADGMADAIAAVNAISPEACRRAASERFSAGRMLTNYLDLYERLAKAAKGTCLAGSKEAGRLLYNEAVA